MKKVYKKMLIEIRMQKVCKKSFYRGYHMKHILYAMSQQNYKILNVKSTNKILTSC